MSEEKKEEKKEENKEEKKDEKKEEKKEEKKDDYVNITEDGGVKKKILKEGKGELPVEGSEVHVNYIGRNSENKVFDQTKDKPFTFKLGENKVIKGWEIGVKTMKVGEKAEFILAPNYAYGDKKVSDLIPENATLTFEIELLKFVVPKKEVSDMTYEEKLAEGKKLKDEGVEKFKAKDIAGARDLFTRAIAYLETMDKSKEAEAEGVDLYVKTLSNLCNCCNQQKEYYTVVSFATKGLKIKELPKFYYFRSIAKANNEEFRDAKEDLASLKKLLGEKEDPGVKFVEELIEKRQKEISAKRKKFSKGLFSQHLYDDIDKKEEEKKEEKKDEKKEEGKEEKKEDAKEEKKEDSKEEKKDETKEEKKEETKEENKEEKKEEPKEEKKEEPKEEKKEEPKEEKKEEPKEEKKEEPKEEKKE